MARGDWDDTKDLIAKGRDWIINEMKASGLRGRGGAGFPTGLKWTFMPKAERRPSATILVVNADESEPGTCKDREILRHDPHKLVEGALIAGFAMRARSPATSTSAASSSASARRCSAPIAEAYEAGLLGKNDVGSATTSTSIVHHGAGAYICGEETAMLESLEGKKGQPRLKPPFPADVGPLRLPDHGQQCRVASRSCRPSCAAARPGSRASAAPNNDGTKLFQHLRPRRTSRAWSRRRCAIPFRELIDKHGGGIRGGWDNLLAVIPGGVVGAAGAGRRRSWTRRWTSTGCKALELGPRHRGGHRHGQVDRHRPRDQPHQLFLQA